MKKEDPPDTLITIKERVNTSKLLNMSIFNLQYLFQNYFSYILIKFKIKLTF